MVRTSGSRFLTTAFAASVLALAGCGGGEGETSPDDALAAVAATCEEAATTLAAAPSPADESGEEQFRAAHQAARSAVLSATRDALQHVDDPALTRMERTLDRVPILQGGWTARTTAAQTLGSLDRLNRHATAAGLPECAAPAWRVADWEATYARHAGERPSDETFIAEIEALCASTLTFTTLGESGDVGAAVAATTARTGLADFVRALQDTVPPEHVQPGFIALLGAVAELRQAIPDVPSAVTDTDAVQTRITLAAADTQDAIDTLGISC